MVRREEVVDWFHKLNGADRLDIMCTLLDICLPFELRFLGTYMENLGRKDFHHLRDADYRANSFLSHNSSSSSRPSGISDKAALINILTDPVSGSSSSTSQQLSSPNNVTASGNNSHSSPSSAEANNAPGGASSSLSGNIKNGN